MVADREGFEAFYRERYARVVRACTLVLLDAAAAEDVAAESFARLWAHWGRIHDDDHAGGYVFTTAMRLCSKRRSRSARVVIGDMTQRSSGTDEASAALLRNEVFGALGRLSVRQLMAEAAAALSRLVIEPTEGYGGARRLAVDWRLRPYDRAGGMQ